MSHALLRWPIILSLAFGVLQSSLNARQPAARKHAPPAPSRAQSKGKSVTLRQGEIIARQLSNEEAHSYLVPLAGGQLLSLSAEQRGVDIVLTLYGPGGERVAEGHSQFSANVSEPLFFTMIAETSGVYCLKVRAKKKNPAAAAGSYEIKVEELREATPFDRRRLVALNLFAEGDHIRASEWAMSSWQPVLEKYEAALALFCEIGDRRAEATTLGFIGNYYEWMSEQTEGSQPANSGPASSPPSATFTTTSASSGRRSNTIKRRFGSCARPSRRIG
ncbi:MAG: hypothetical protein LC802_11375 [Acidobacteria bacterium]|nr:hypothetical protein [Acidobacteriota bacterium]